MTLTRILSGPPAWEPMPCLWPDVMIPGGPADCEGPIATGGTARLSRTDADDIWPVMDRFMPGVCYTRHLERVTDCDGPEVTASHTSEQRWLICVRGLQYGLYRGAHPDTLDAHYRACERALWPEAPQAVAHTMCRLGELIEGARVAWGEL